MKRQVTAVLLAAGLVVLAACGAQTEDLGGEPMAADVDVVVEAAADAMGQVKSVHFRLDRGGAPVFIDPVESLAIDAIEGRVIVPDQADALMDVTVNGSLATQLGAVALDGNTWLSNPVTGDFEPLPPSYNLDPRKFFDPAGAWRPLIETLVEPELLGIEDHDGQRYHVRGTAPAERIEAVTARLVRSQDVVVDLWIHPVSGLVTGAEFDTVFEDKTSSWTLTLTQYGADFEIVSPDAGD